MSRYPMTTGRSMTEIARLVVALRPSAAHRVSPLEALQPGDDCLLPPPQAVGEVAERARAGRWLPAWHLAQQ